MGEKQSYYQICFTVVFFFLCEYLVFHFHANLIFSSFLVGALLPVPGVPENTTKMPLKQWLSNKHLPWAQGSCTLPDL